MPCGAFWDLCMPNAAMYRTTCQVFETVVFQKGLLPFTLLNVIILKPSKKVTFWKFSNLNQMLRAVVKMSG